MAHVEIGYDAAGDCGSLKVDGTDLSLAALRDGFTIDLGTSPPTVHILLAVDTLEVDLPESVLEAMRSTEDEPESSGDFEDFLVGLRKDVNRLSAEVKRQGRKLDDKGLARDLEAAAQAVRKVR